MSPNVFSSVIARKTVYQRETRTFLNRPSIPLRKDAVTASLDARETRKCISSKKYILYISQSDHLSLHIQSRRRIISLTILFFAPKRVMLRYYWDATWKIGKQTIHFFILNTWDSRNSNLGSSEIVFILSELIFLEILGWSELNYLHKQLFNETMKYFSIRAWINVTSISPLQVLWLASGGIVTSLLTSTDKNYWFDNILIFLSIFPSVLSNGVCSLSFPNKAPNGAAAIIKNNKSPANYASIMPSRVLIISHEFDFLNTNYLATLASVL